MSVTEVTGQQIATALRANFGVGTRTRRYRDGEDLHDTLIEAIENAAQYPGYYSPERTVIFSAASGAARSYRKHVGGYRIDGELRRRITGLSPWQFAGLIGEIVDAGITNTGQGEQFFERMARNLAAA